MSDIKRFNQTGVHTIEGNMAGDLAAYFSKQSQAQQEEYELMKIRIKNNQNTTLKNINDKFSTSQLSTEDAFRKRTIGLITAEDFRKAREEEEEKDGKNKCSSDQIDQRQELSKEQEQKLIQQQNKRKKLMSTLSFYQEEDNEEEVLDIKTIKANKKLKDPTIDTSFLPDLDREKELQKKKEQLSQEWIELQEQIKLETLTIVYSYWDGSGHRLSCGIKKGFTISKFLEIAKQQIIKEFSDLRSTSSEDLMFVKEDLILPHHLTFYDLIVTKARGKSGPLFHFDVHDDIRLVNDATIEKDESHPGKIVTRRWYEKNKHIFPASRWELYDPTKLYDQPYKIH